MATKYKLNNDEVRWRAHWRDDTGRQRSKNGWTTRKTARAWELKMQREKEDRVLGHFTVARKTPLRDWISEWWRLNNESRPKLTRDSYADAINRCIDPYIGGLPLALLSTARVAEWRDELLEAGFTNHSVVLAMRVLSSALGKAVERGLIPQGSNPVRDASKPPISRAADKRPLAPVQVEWIRTDFLVHRAANVSDLSALRSATLASVLAYGGLRPSEGLGLKAPEVDFEARGVWVRDVFAGEHRPNDTKTHRGRFVPLHDSVMDDLALWLAAREATEGKLRGRVWLFPDTDGEVTEYTHRNWAGRPWKTARLKACELAPDLADEVEIATPYTLRGSMVSVEARAAGRDLDWQGLADRAGHTMRTMLQYYLRPVRALENAPRVPVAEQIGQAREITGSGVAARELAERIIGRKPAVAPLIELNAARTRRAG